MDFELKHGTLDGAYLYVGPLLAALSVNLTTTDRAPEVKSRCSSLQRKSDVTWTRSVHAVPTPLCAELRPLRRDYSRKCSPREYPDQPRYKCAAM
jgi:hypothetical protein